MARKKAKKVELDAAAVTATMQDLVAEWEKNYKDAFMGEIMIGSGGGGGTATTKTITPRKAGKAPSWIETMDVIGDGLGLVSKKEAAEALAQALDELTLEWDKFNGEIKVVWKGVVLKSSKIP